MKPILQSSLFQLKILEISSGLFLLCLLAAPTHAARHSHGTGERMPKTWPWHWGEGAHLSTGRFCPKRPQKLGCTHKYSSTIFFKFVSSLLSLSSLLWFYFWGSTPSAVTIHPPGLLGWHLAITSLMHLLSSSW